MGKYVGRKVLAHAKRTHLHGYTHAQQKVLIQPKGWPLLWSLCQKCKFKSWEHSQVFVWPPCTVDLVSGHLQMQIRAVNGHVLVNMAIIKYSIPPLLSSPFLAFLALHLFPSSLTFLSLLFSLSPPSAGPGPTPSADDSRLSSGPEDSGGGCSPAGLPHAPWLQLQAWLQWVTSMHTHTRIFMNRCNFQCKRTFFMCDVSNVFHQAR